MIFSVGMSSRFPIDEVLDTVELLDMGGIYSVLIEDEANYSNVYVLLALAAKRTKHIKIGTGVTNPLTRHPVITASAIATIDQISSGRALLGIGAGGTATMVALGVDTSRPVGKLKIVVPILQKLLGGERVTSSEGPFPIRDVALGILPIRKIPIYIAGRGPRILEAGGLLADGVIAGAGLFTPQAMAYARENILRGTNMVGRNIKEVDIVAWAYTSVSENADQAIEPIARFAYLTARSAPISVWQPTGLDISFVEKVKKEAIPQGDFAHLVPQLALNQFGLAGTPSYCRKRLREMAEAGIEHVGLLVFPVPELGLKGTVELVLSSVIKEFIN